MKFTILIKKIMEKVSDKKKNNNKIEVLKDPFEENKNKLSPAFPKPLPLGRKAGEQKDKAEKSHHDFLKLSQENKYPLGKAIEKKEYTKQEVIFIYSLFNNPLIKKNY